MKTDDVIFVAGGRGLVGSAIIRKLESIGCQTILAPTSKQLDLTDQTAVKHYFHCLLYTSPSPRDLSTSRMPSSA